MAGLQRSEISFRRQGSSGLVWDDKFLSGELNQLANLKQENNNKDNKSNQHQGQENKDDGAAPAAATESSAGRVPGLTIERSRSNGGGRGFRTGRVSPAIEPPSPKVSACGFCSAFGKNDKTRRQPPKSGKRVM